ncbi:MAG: thymidylate synthase [Candidatus Marsarchaeota archaeon]|nr:thymidylate synthase [Candidatus Marsarchaeota archaeon]
MVNTFREDNSSTSGARVLVRKESNADEAYLGIVNRILKEGKWKENRTGVRTLAIAGATFEHDMASGFPLLTTKKMGLQSVAAELEFFIRGVTDKKWLQDRKCTIWDEWANPEKAPYGHDEKSKVLMRAERDLGPVYGWQWRHFGAEYISYDTDYTGKGYDQLAVLIEKLKKDPNDRRQAVSAWNPNQISKMALPPCHWGFHVTIINNRLNLTWNQRSVDTMLGLPYNIASYALLLHLLTKEIGKEVEGLKEGKLVGFLSDVHIYESHMKGVKEQISRDPRRYPSPKVQTDHFKSIFEWEYTDTKKVGYESYPKIEFPIAV